MASEIDVLIIGGGPQGFWILDQLQQDGFCCHLWECNRVGAGQAAHAEWFLHRGHLFPTDTKAPFVPLLKSSAERWEAKFSVGDPKARSKSYVGFKSPHEDYQVTDAWNNRGLNYSRVNPAALSLHSDFGVVFETQETCIAPEPVFSHFVETFAPSTSYVGSDISVEFSDNGSIEQVTATGQDDLEGTTVQPQLVVLTAGAANAGILRERFGIADEAGIDIQSDRHGALLVLRDPEKRLPAETVFDWESRLFVVARPFRFDTQEHLWIVGTEGTWKDSGESPFTPDETREAIRNIWRKLSLGSKFIHDLRQELQFAVCTGALVSQNHKAGFRNVHEFANPSNLIAVWPQRLTLSPHWSDEVVRFVKQRIGKNRRQQCHLPVPKPRHFRPHWEDGFVDWPKFHADYPD